MIILGIDPGASGAIAQLYTEIAGEWHVCTFKLDTTERDIADFFALRQGNPIFAYLERAQSMPKQGVVSSFKFGMNYGFLRGCLISLGIPFEEVGPRKWQQAMGCLSGGDKNVTKARAQQLFPSIKVTHAIADSILIAEYGRRLRAGEL